MIGQTRLDTFKKRVYGVYMILASVSKSILQLLKSSKDGDYKIVVLTFCRHLTLFGL